ncbi:Arb2 domain-containing protein [Ampelomyces quisqualis]|uniref:Arb2 domain-containing protein n=1 Tax=Ampelomyces quisqualis TaxID=50730 RepID=A0A6A5QF67_AMPQU|nr:Arb2 domain-containing protein [Ampelomyces quisqualis]
MFRRQEDTMDPDPVYEADLKALGFFVNQDGQIRMIDAPDKEYVFYATNNERVNELRREAMQGRTCHTCLLSCSRQETEKRLAKLGINRIYLPGFVTAKPTGPHVPILAPAPHTLKTRKRIIVIINDATQDLGILAYRQLLRELGLNGATVVSVAKELIKRSATDDATGEHVDMFQDGWSLKDDSETPALIVLNTGQLLYSHKHNRAMTLRSWSAMPRKSIVHNMVNIHEEENRVEGHRNPKEHVKSVFDSILCNPDRTAPDSELYLVAIEGGTETLLNLLGEDFQKYGTRITSMALVHSLIDDSQIKSPELRAFLHQRAREWRYSDLTWDPTHCTKVPENYASEAPGLDTHVGTHIVWNEKVPESSVLTGVTKALQRLAVRATPSKGPEAAAATSELYTDWSSGQAAICPTFAGGDDPAGECIFTNAAVQQAILSFFEEVAQDPENYCNPNFQLYSEAPHPSLDNPLILDPDNPNICLVQPSPVEMTPAKAELDLANEKLSQMGSALQACPQDVPELQPGRKKLMERITNQETKVERLRTKALAAGGLTAGEAPQQRENWKPQKEGPKVQFAGTEVDSELLKAAGLTDTADEELGKLDKSEA